MAYDDWRSQWQRYVTKMPAKAQTQPPIKAPPANNEEGRYVKNPTRQATPKPQYRQYLPVVQNAAPEQPQRKVAPYWFKGGRWQAQQLASQPGPQMLPVYLRGQQTPLPTMYGVTPKQLGRTGGYDYMGRDMSKLSPVEQLIAQEQAQLNYNQGIYNRPGLPTSQMAPLPANLTAMNTATPSEMRFVKNPTRPAMPAWQEDIESVRNRNWALTQLMNARLTPDVNEQAVMPAYTGPAYTETPYPYPYYGGGGGGGGYDYSNKPQPWYMNLMQWRI